MPTYAVTVLGHDRPGIVAEVTEAVAALGGNLEDSSMTLLRGHFAMTLIAAVDAPGDAIREPLEPLAQTGLVVSVLELAEHPSEAVGQQGYVLSVHGGDRPGIVSAVTRRIADLGGNITDLSTRLAGELYVLVAEVALPPDQEAAAVAAMREVGGSLGVTVHFAAVDEDVM